MRVKNQYGPDTVSRLLPCVHPSGTRPSLFGGD
jgi:hypothetical protein